MSVVVGMCVGMCVCLCESARARVCTAVYFKKLHDSENRRIALHRIERFSKRRQHVET